MKVFAILLLCLLVLAKSEQEVTATQLLGLQDVAGDDNGAKEAVEVVGGILAGAFGSFSSITACYSDTKDVFTDFKNAYSNLKLEHYDGVKGGLIHIGKALLKIPDAVKSCKDIAKFMEKIKTVAVRFSNPTLLTVTVGKNILWHSISIYKEVKAAITAYNSNLYWAFGTSIGKIINTVFLSKTQQQLQSDGSEFMKGFAHGVSPSTYTDVEECLNSVSPETIDRIKKDIDDISVKHIERSIEAIQDIGNAFVEIINSCESGKESVKNLAKKLLEAFTGNVFFKAAMEILKNPIKFMNLVNKINSDFKNKYYFAAGEDIGEFVGTVLGTRFEPTVSIIKSLL